MSGTAWTLVAVASALGILVWTLGLVALIHRIQGRATASAASDPAVGGAMLVCGGLLQRGVLEDGRQLNGNGVVAVYPDEIRFVLGGRPPRRSFSIPRSAITRCEVTRSLKLPGIRRAGGPMWLVLRWTRNGVEHGTGFQTPRAEEILGTLQAAG